MSGNGKNVDGLNPSVDDLRKMYGVEAFEEATGPVFRISEWGMDRYAGAAEPIDWLIEDVAARHPRLDGVNGGNRQVVPPIGPVCSGCRWPR